MKRPWQIWTLYLLGLALVLPPMAWLTVKALELDRAELQARQQVELEEKVSRALWRMDVFLSPLLAQEAARPEFVYRPVLQGVAEGKGKPRQALSPLLVEPPEFVIVNFELHADGTLTSPQLPTGTDNAWAISNGASGDIVCAAETHLAEIRSSLQHGELLALLPDQSLPGFELSPFPGFNKLGQSSGNTSIVANTYDNSASQKLQQQMEQSKQAPIEAAQQVQGEPSAAFPNQSPEFTAANAPGQAGELSQPPQVANNSRVFGGGRGQRSQTRGSNDLVNREAAYQAEAQRAYVEQRSNYKELTQPPRGIEGISQPLWLGTRLILARRVQSGDKTLIQGCWLDWEKLKNRLLVEVADLDLPEITFLPVNSTTNLEQNHLLATVPVQLAVAVPLMEPAWDSPIRISLLAAWLCLIAGAVFAAVTLRGVVALSERRGAFVAAVTHELRTPLTTFRMYAEMLAEGMVPQAEQRQKYLETLRREADRLAHLVDNVLQYARLERGRPGGRREPLSVTALMERMEPCLADRATQAEMKLEVSGCEALADVSLNTDPGAVEQILFNLVDNACKYAACVDDKRIHLELSRSGSFLEFRVRDHGPGISSAGRRKLFRPFSKSVHEAANSAPGVGLGLALSRRLASDLGGSLELVAADANQPGIAFRLRLRIA